MQICIEQIDEKAILTRFHAIIPVNEHVLR